MEEIQDLLKGYPVVIQQSLAWGEMDAMRHVNNVVYFRYFENVRIEYLKRIGWIDWEVESGIGPILGEVRARFRKPLTFPDTISITAKLGSLSEDRFTLEHIVISHSQKALTTEGDGTIVAFNYQEKKKTPIPEDLRQRILELEAAQTDLR